MTKTAPTAEETTMPESIAGIFAQVAADKARNLAKLDAWFEEVAQKIKPTLASRLRDVLQGKKLERVSWSTPREDIRFSPKTLKKEDIESLPGYRRLHAVCADTFVDMKVCVFINEEKHGPGSSYASVSVDVQKPYAHSCTFINTDSIKNAWLETQEEVSPDIENPSLAEFHRATPLRIFQKHFLPQRREA